jgi:hypothetical protein
MGSNRATRLLLVLACLTSAGCAGLPLDAAPANAAKQTRPAEEEHLSLERELSLYSD